MITMQKKNTALQQSQHEHTQRELPISVGAFSDILAVVDVLFRPPPYHKNCQNSHTTYACLLICTIGGLLAIFKAMLPQSSPFFVSLKLAASSVAMLSSCAIIMSTARCDREGLKSVVGAILGLDLKPQSKR
jgi:hypothetical protein